MIDLFYPVDQGDASALCNVLHLILFFGVGVFIKFVVIADKFKYFADCIKRFMRILSWD